MKVEINEINDCLGAVENKNTLRLLEADFIEELSSKQQQNSKRSTDVTESTI